MSLPLTLLAISLQCPVPEITEISNTFNPANYLDQYSHPNYIEDLIDYVNSPTKLSLDAPFTNSGDHISNLTLIVKALYLNGNNEQLLFNTTAWLIGRVNSVPLFLALSILAADGLLPGNVPTVTEVFPQLFIPNLVVAQKAKEPVWYFTQDPGLNEFHVQWHVENPHWWNGTLFQVERPRRGELFLYMHHQVLSRYMMERYSNELEGPSPLELVEGFDLGEGYYPNVVNINLNPFPIRLNNTRLFNEDLEQMRVYEQRIKDGIDKMEFVGRESNVTLAFENGANILGDTIEASKVYSSNYDFYGTFHNLIHNALSMIGWDFVTPGVEAHPEASMRDPVFYRLHKTINLIYKTYKFKLPQYNKEDLVYDGVELQNFKLDTTKQQNSTSIITTYFEESFYNTSLLNCKEQTANITRLNHKEYKFNFTVYSKHESIQHGLARVFITMTKYRNGTAIPIQDTFYNAIEMDRFYVPLQPGINSFTRSSLSSTLTTTRPTLHTLLTSSNVPRSRGCGFPQNLMMPKGTTEGLHYKMHLMISRESSKVSDLPGNILCGTIKGVLFPDSKPLGYPFDRDGIHHYFPWKSHLPNMQHIDFLIVHK